MPLRGLGIIDSQSPTALARIFRCWFVNAPCADKILLAAPQPFRAAEQTSADHRVMVVFHQIKVSILVNR